MTVLRASNAPIGLNRGKPNRAANPLQRTAWTRPSDWVTFTTPADNEQKLIGTVAVWNQASNYIALSCTTSTGTFTVDWGDGTSANFTSGTTAEKNYVWGDISSGTLTSLGYRQAVITVTPTTSGATFSAVNLNRRHSGITSNGSLASNPWLDVAVSAPNATTIAFAYSEGGTRTASMQLVEQINIVSHNMATTANLFRELRQLQSVAISSTASVTTMQQMFQTCAALQTAPFMNTASVTTMNTMFSGCRSLETVPLYNTAAVTDMGNMFTSCTSLQNIPLFNTAAVTSMTNMFSGCSSLQTVPLFNTAAVTNMGNMFGACATLQTIPLFNTAAVINMSSMFSTCSSLQTVPLFNTAAVTSMSSMFISCTTLKMVPLFNTAAVTDMSNMFTGCPSLETVPLLNTAAVTNMSNMFSSCFSLETVPLFNTAAVTNMSNMFSNASNLKNVPLFNTAAVTNMSNMFSNCSSLQTVPLFNTAAVTNMTSMFSDCYALQNIPELNQSLISGNTSNNLGLGNATVNSAAASLGQAKLTGNRWSQSFQNCRMGAPQLDEMYTALATLNPAVTNVTGSGTTVTYTIADRRAFVAGRTVTITGVDPVAYNLTNVTVGTVTAGAGNTGTFTVTNAATGTYVSGGVATLQDNKTITVTSNPGTTGDDPTIATNKGWTVTGS